MLKHVASNWTVTALQIVVLMFLTRFVVRTLGGDLNGVWVTVVSLTGFLSLLILGVPMASVRYVAEEVAKGDVAGTNRAVSTCLGICLGLGAAALAAGGLLFAVFELGYVRSSEWAELPPEVLSQARTAFVVVVLQVAAGFALRLPYGIFDAYHDFVQKNAIVAAELVLRGLLTYLLLSRQASLVFLAFVQVACTAFEFGIALAILKRRHPGVRFSLSAFDRSLVKKVLSFSMFALVLNVGSMLAFRCDALVIGRFIDPAAVTSFDNGNKFFEPLTGLVLGIGVVVMPTATKLRTAGRLEELRPIFLKWSKVSLSIVLAVSLYLLVLGPEFLGWWIAPEYEALSGPVLQILALSFIVFLPVRGVALPILMGLGRPARPALALLVMGALNVALSIALVGPLGIEGVALGTAIPNVLFAGAVLWLACRELGVPVSEYVLYVAGRASVGALAPLGVGLALEYGIGIEGFVPLVASGILMVAVFALVWVLFVFRGDPHIDLRAMLARRAAREAP